MGQTSFFDVERRLEAISAKGDPLETIKKIVRWEDFRSRPETSHAQARYGVGPWAVNYVDPADDPRKKTN